MSLADPISASVHSNIYPTKMNAQPTNAQSQQNSQQNVIEVWEPTYRQKPADDQRFIPSTVQTLIETIVQQRLQYQTYDDAECKQLALEICNTVKEEVKKLRLPRYKLIFQSIIGEMKHQGCHVVSRSLWDDSTDNYATYSYKNSSLFCTLLVFGTYLE